MTADRKRRRTLWRYRATYGGGGAIKVGYLHRPKTGDPTDEDVIRLRIDTKRRSGEIDFAMRIDEAAAIVAGLSSVISRMLFGLYPMTRKMP